MAELVFLHLSDIHLREEELASGVDLDLDLRDELVRDLKKLRGTAFDSLDGVLLTGDVAFAGKKAEYISARTWLESLQGEFGFPEGNIWAVPGNHDVDRTLVRSSAQSTMVRATVRDAGEEGAANALHALLKDTTAHTTLLDPMKLYNEEFANGIQCSTRCPKLYWTSRIPLGEDYEVVFYGLNSASISDANDHVETGKLVLGLSQLQAIKRRRGAINVSLCHHPPNWLLDGQDVSKYLGTRTSLQLFGHEHRSQLQCDGESVLISAGALHPQRDEDEWHPHYNLISLHTSDAGADAGRLAIRVWPRTWDDDATEFRAAPDQGAEDSETFTVQLPDPLPGQGDCGKSAAPVVLPVDAADSLEADAPTAEEALPVPRDIVYRFYLLSWLDRLRIAFKLGLCQEADSDADEGEIGRRIFLRACERKLLDSLRVAIDTRLAELRVHEGH